jgi:hypothetical protein
MPNQCLARANGTPLDQDRRPLSVVFVVVVVVVVVVVFVNSTRRMHDKTTTRPASGVVRCSASGAIPHKSMWNEDGRNE